MPPEWNSGASLPMFLRRRRNCECKYSALQDQLLWHSFAPRTGWDQYPLVDLFPPQENPAMPSKNKPGMSGYFNMNFIPCLIALLITHREYSSVNDINDIYSSIMSCCWFVVVPSWENVLFTLKNIETCAKITWKYLPCVVYWYTR